MGRDKLRGVSMKEDFIERRIITGMIISTGYLERLNRIWDPLFLDSPEFRKVAMWCMAHYEKYHTAPDADIEAIYMSKLKDNQISKSEAVYIEAVMNDISDEYGRDANFNVAYLYDQTVRYFKGQELQRHNEEIQALTDAGKIEEAETLAQSYHSTIIQDISLGLDLSSPEAMDRMEAAFNPTAQRVVHFPGALGRMMNEHMIRGGFVSFLAPEKRGKTFMLMEIAMRAYRQHYNVAFFQGGDMTEDSMLKRLGIYLTRRSDQEKYCIAHFAPVGDCIYNQLDLCTRKDRNCNHGIFTVDETTFMQEKAKFMTIDILKEKYAQFPKYLPCDSRSCNRRKGSVWLRKVKQVEPLDGPTARKAAEKFFKKNKRHFKLMTYPAGSLTPSEIDRVLTQWDKQDGFVPDTIIVDYADLQVADAGLKGSDYRQQTNQVWQGDRGLAQKWYALFVTATQADADSYKQGRLNKGNFSEDKRKYAHVTAMYGLNQDPNDREKKIGVMRINEIVVREGEFSNDTEVTVLHDLYQGRPFLESF
jgi:hypothetical protein